MTAAIVPFPQPSDAPEDDMSAALIARMGRALADHGIFPATPTGRAVAFIALRLSGFPGAAITENLELAISAARLVATVRSTLRARESE